MSNEHRNWDQELVDLYCEVLNIVPDSEEHTPDAMIRSSRRDMIDDAPASMRSFYEDGIQRDERRERSSLLTQLNIYLKHDGPIQDAFFRAHADQVRLLIVQSNLTLGMHDELREEFINSAINQDMPLSFEQIYPFEVEMEGKDSVELKKVEEFKAQLVELYTRYRAETVQLQSLRNRLHEIAKGLDIEVKKPDVDRIFTLGDQEVRL